LFTEDWKRETSKVSECRDALMKKFGLKEVSVPFTFTAEDIREMKYEELQKLCGARQYNLFNKDMPRGKATGPEMKDALMKKFGLEGSIVSDHQQKLEESSKATAIFFQLASVVAITSTISNFNPKNQRHAESFMEQYRKKHGKGPTRSQNST
jgi:hypothetical protein